MRVPLPSADGALICVTAFYDFNVTANARAKYWTVPSMWPYWSGIFPKEVLASQYTAQRAFAPVAYLTARYNGTLPHSLLDTGFQWDMPSSWPSLTWVAQQAVLAIPDSLAKESMESYVRRTSNFSYLPDGVFGLAESDLPPQNFADTSTANLTTARPFGESGNVGDTSTYSKTNWRDGLAIAMANRYTAAAFCSWYATGGSIPGLLAQVRHPLASARAEADARASSTTRLSTRPTASATPATCLKSSPPSPSTRPAAEASTLCRPGEWHASLCPELAPMAASGSGGRTACSRRRSGHSAPASSRPAVPTFARSTRRLDHQMLLLQLHNLLTTPSTGAHLEPADLSRQRAPPDL